MNKFNIMWDMDGVMVDLDPTLSRLSGVSLSILKDKKLKSDHYDPYIAALIQVIKEGKTPFLDAEPMSDFQDLQQWILENRDIHTQSILSSGTSVKEVYDVAIVEKSNWLKKHQLGFLPRIFSIGSAKKQEVLDRYSVNNRCNCVLIDDYEKNIIQWNGRGGVGIHHIDAASTLKKLKNIVGK